MRRPSTVLVTALLAGFMLTSCSAHTRSIAWDGAEDGGTWAFENLLYPCGGLDCIFMLGMLAVGVPTAMLFGALDNLALPVGLNDFDDYGRKARYGRPVPNVPRGLPGDHVNAKYTDSKSGPSRTGHHRNPQTQAGSPELWTVQIVRPPAESFAELLSREP